MKSGLHDIVNGLAIARAHAEIIAEDIEQADPKAAAILRNCVEEIWDVWTEYRPMLPTNYDIGMLSSGRRNESPHQTNQENIPIPDTNI